MNMTSSLHDFVTKTGAKNRITFGDVRRLQRNILPDGVSTREEAELLIRLDGRVARTDGAWTDWLVVAIVDFVVWGERPTGAVGGEAARWLKGVLTATGITTKAARRIAREIRREAEIVEEPMASFAVENETPLAAEGECAAGPVQVPTECATSAVQLAA
jgi:hypothetical protein